MGNQSFTEKKLREETSFHIKGITNFETNVSHFRSILVLSFKYEVILENFDLKFSLSLIIKEKSKDVSIISHFCT